MENDPKNLAALPHDEEMDRLRALFAQSNQPRPRTGIRKFFHDLAERSAQPSKSIILARLNDES